ncbi:DUF4190 domain-containing protein [Streptomyces sp. CYG20]|nr:DUF4190 domain-containing protein [Streptomyces sp. COG21]MBT3080193.1 DUF4190 domain-containing protein [Streptomyces sp. COG20]MBT3089504.1 DUF4190 domain-containing protein [Streptomyces sp. CYG21]MBT3099535.1 DUF4190 domain-containing protein [Streptomyces sp. CBG30]MBT3105934.1 DUF4190 domain-containing protein [Streptomyces sp. COG19]MBT3112513.1 DUF4190 domain-containing protein [Streptomyces sp. CYG20]
MELGKKDATPPPPAVHDQQTVTSMPSAGPAPDGTGPIPTGGGFGPPPSAVPPPPIGPGGPGQAAPQPPTAGHYGYPAPPAQPYGGYPGYDAYGGHQPWGPQPSNGLGTAALVLGIISVVGFCMYGVNIVLGILALIFGIIGLGRAKRGEATNRGMAIAGIITGSVGIVLGSVILGFIVWAVANGEDFEDGYEDDPFATSLVIEGRG